MRLRRLVHAALSRPRHTAAVGAVLASVTAAIVAPMVVVSSAAASAEETTASTVAPDTVHVDLTAPFSVARGAGATLVARLTAAGVAVPGRQVRFVARPNGASTWDLVATATTGTDGTTSVPVTGVARGTEYGAYYSDVNGTVTSQTATAVVHVIDLRAAAPRTVRPGARFAVVARLLQDASGLAGQRVQVRFRSSSHAAWGASHWATTSSSGVAKIATRLSRTMQVGVQFPGAGVLAASPLRVTTVRVVRIATTTSGFRFPFLNPSQVQSPGSWSLDQGVDMFANGDACGAAAKLVAVGDGTVVQTGISGFGPTAPVIRMSSGPFRGRNVYYGHTGHIYVHVGEHVRAGQLVAQIGCGSVGYSSAPHLEIGVGEPGGPPCCPPWHATASQMYRQLVLALRRS